MKFALFIPVVSCLSLPTAGKMDLHSLSLRADNYTYTIQAVQNLTAAVNTLGTTINSWPSGRLEAESIARAFTEFTAAQYPEIQPLLNSPKFSEEQLSTILMTPALAYQKSINDTVKIIVGRKSQIAESRLCGVTRLALEAAENLDQVLHDAMAPQLPSPYNVFANPSQPLWAVAVDQFSSTNCTDGTAC